MRKGLVVTLGVVALFIAVSPVFSLAPVISCIPDVIISDAEQNSQTQDRNFFIFSAALNLDDLVRDDDAATKSALRWSFVETNPGTSIQINGIAGMVSPTPDQIKDPGASNLRAVNKMATFRNVTWSPVSGSMPFPTPTQSSMTSTLQMYVSDGTSYTGQAMLVRSVNTAAGAVNPQLDSVALQSQKNYTFTSGAENWMWFDYLGAYPTPAVYGVRQAAGGSLQIGKTSGTAAALVFGGWETPKDPSLALKARWGCVVRARYQMRSSVTGAGCPGFRMQAWWRHVAFLGGQWVVNFANQDYADGVIVGQDTTNVPPAFPFIPGREPGTTAKTYTLLYYPQQVSTLMNSDTIVYITCDMVDGDSFNEDMGTLFIDAVDVDGFARPSLGMGLRNVPEFTTTNFSAWEKGVTQLPLDPANPPVVTGLINTNSATNLLVTVPQGNRFLEAWFTTPSPGTAVKAGHYYRLLWRINTDRTASNDFAPTLRTTLMASNFLWYAHKVMDGGGLNSLIGATTQDYEQWICAPSVNPPSTSLTEAMKLRWEVYVLGIPNTTFNKNISGTVRCVGVTTEEFAPMP